MMMRAAAVLLAAAPVAFARVNSADLNKDVALEALTKIGSLKSMDMEDVMCDECLSEIDCIWPCEIMCVLDVPDEYAGEVCQICLEFFGCEGCKFLCPSLDTASPSSAPTTEPTLAPSAYEDSKMSALNYTAPSGSPTLAPSGEPTTAPSVSPTLAPTSEPTVGPTMAPTTEPTVPPTESPTAEPTLPPTSEPSYAPTATPSMAPYTHPSAAPSVAPSTFPSVVPSASPTAEPTVPPSIAPTSSPSFLLYYSKDNDKLYEYNPTTEVSSELFNGDFTGDLKVDSINYFMFWSEPTYPSQLVKYDLASGTQTDIVKIDSGIMGICLDPSEGTLYFANQGSLSIDVVNYDGSNHSTLHDIASKELVPYGIDMSPAEIADGDTDSDPGYLMFTAADTLYGYIYQGDLFGSSLEKIYTSDSKDLFGIILDDANSKMWWIENKGVANGLYNAGFDAGESNFIAYLEGAYWVAALWDEDIMYVADYEEGTLYEFEIEGDDVSSTTEVVTADNMRCVAFWSATASSDTPDSGDNAMKGGAGTREKGMEAAPMDGDADAEPSPDVVETGDAARAAGDMPAAEEPVPSEPDSGSEDTDALVAEAESESTETDGVQTTEPPAWNAAPETSPGQDTDAEPSPFDEDLGIKARPAPDTEASQDLPPTNVNNGMSAMGPSAKKLSHISGSDQRTSPEMTAQPKLPQGAGAMADLKEESNEEEASTFPTTVLTVGGIAAAVALSAFVVYSRRSQGGYRGLGHEAI